MSRGSVMRRGNSWRARYRDDDGRDRQRTFARKGDADRWVRDQLSALASGQHVDPSAGSVSFADYAAQWLESQHVRPSTARLQSMRLRLYISPVVGSLALRQVRRSHVVAVVGAMVESGLSPLVVKFTIATMRAVLASAVSDRLVPVNVADDRSIAMPRKAREAMVPLTSEEIAAIASAIAPRYRALVLLGAATGMRSGELRGLTVDRISPAIHLGALDVVPRQASVRVDRQLAVGRVLAPTKTDSSVRDVTIGTTTVAALTERVRTFGIGADGFVFTNSVGAPIDSATLSVAWTKALAKAGVRADVSVHDLRHHCASAMLSAGVNIAAVSKLLGHGSPAITLSTYAWAMPSDEQRVLDASEAIASALA